MNEKYKMSLKEIKHKTITKNTNKQNIIFFFYIFKEQFCNNYFYNFINILSSYKVITVLSTMKILFRKKVLGSFFKYQIF